MVIKPKNMETYQTNMMKGKIRLYYNTIASNNHKIETICDYVIFPGLGMLLKMSLVYRKFAID